MMIETLIQSYFELQIAFDAGQQNWDIDVFIVDS